MIGDYIFCVEAAREIQLVSYGSKHALRSLSAKPFVCTYMQNLKTIDRTIIREIFIV